MIIPERYGQVNFTFAGNSLPHDAQISFGIWDQETQDLPEIMDKLEAAAPILLPYVSQPTPRALRNIRCKMGPNDTGQAMDRPMNIAGNDPGPAAPPNLAILVKKQSVMGGHRGVGRFYLPGCAENKVDENGVLEATLVTDIQTRCDAFLHALEISAIPMMLFHNRPTDTPSKVTNLVVDGRAATQRRRMRR